MSIAPPPNMATAQRSGLRPWISWVSPNVRRLPAAVFGLARKRFLRVCLVFWSWRPLFSRDAEMNMTI